VAAFAAYLMLNSMIDGQNQRNEKLRAEIRLLDKQIEEINNLESSKQKFIARMEIIEKLQRSRPEIVHLFDEIVKQLPEGVYLTAVKQQDKRLRFDGIAQSSTRVSAFMRNIDGAEWLRGAELEIVQSAAGSTPGQAFTLYADQVSNAGDDSKAGSKKLASAGGSK
jgi:type IV pilus assembly protein PilN